MVFTDIDIDVRAAIKKYTEYVADSGVPVIKTVVFGSYAKGSAGPHSDIDVAIVSSQFGDNSIDDLQMLLKKAWRVDSRIEPHPLSVEEYEHGYGPLTHEIRKYGIEVPA